MILLGTLGLPTLLTYTPTHWRHILDTDQRSDFPRIYLFVKMYCPGWSPNKSEFWCVLGKGEQTSVTGEYLKQKKYNKMEHH